MDKKQCFVIMPFSKTTNVHDESYWTEFFIMLQKIMDENNFECVRSEVGPYKLFSNIVANIESSNVVIAVLTDYNANVWYELGIRHTLKQGTIMLLQEGQKPPFDISDFGIIFYKDSIGLERSLAKEIKKYLEKLQGDVCDSPVLYSLNNGVNINLEKRLGEMEKLIWKIIDEIPRKNVGEKNKNKRNRVLWVDDYPINNELVIDFFESRGIRFDIALTTKQGIELFKNELYDMIITDMGRGEKSDAGIELLQELDYLHCQVPVVVYASRQAIERYGDEALELGAYSVTNGIRNIIYLISDILQL